MRLLCFLHVCLSILCAQLDHFCCQLLFHLENSDSCACTDGSGFDVAFSLDHQQVLEKVSQSNMAHFPRQCPDSMILVPGQTTACPIACTAPKTIILPPCRAGVFALQTVLGIVLHCQKDGYYGQICCADATSQWLWVFQLIVASDLHGLTDRRSCPT